MKRSIYKLIMMMLVGVIIFTSVSVSASAFVTNTKLFIRTDFTVETDDSPNFVSISYPIGYVNDMIQYYYDVATMNSTRRSQDYIYMRTTKKSKVEYKGIVGDINNDKIIDRTDYYILKYYVYSTNNKIITKDIYDEVKGLTIIYRRDNINGIDPRYDLNNDKIIDYNDINILEKYLKSTEIRREYVGRLIICSRIEWYECDPYLNTTNTYYIESNLGFIPSNVKIINNL